LQRSGITDKAAEDERKKLSFQLHSIKAQFMDVLGDIGAEALEKVNGGFAKGATLAEKFQNILSSDKGRDMVKAIGQGIGSVVDGLLKLAIELPRAISFVSENKGLLMAIGGTYAALRVTAGARAALAGAGVGLKGLGGPMPVHVTNAAEIAMGGKGGAGANGGLLGKAFAAAAALEIGYAIGKVLDAKFGLSDKASDAMREVTGRAAEDRAREATGVNRNRAELAALAAAKRNRVSQLEAGGMAHGKALAQAQSEIDGLKIGTLNVQFGANDDVPTMARKLAEPLARELERRRRNATANGAAP
jgi:hypothetical protein